MNVRRPLCLIVLAALAAPSSAQAPAEAAPSKKKETYRVAGGGRDGVSAFDRVTYAELTPEKAGAHDPRHFHTYEESTDLIKA